jgi:thioredoxin 1
MKNLTDENHEEIIKNTSVLVIKFEADWCMPCKFITPILEELSEKYKEQIEVVKCNVDENPKSANNFSIRNIPTVLFIKNGVVYDTQVGAVPKNIYENKLMKLI